jgi:hypothetical protein
MNLKYLNKWKVLGLVVCALGFIACKKKSNYFLDRHKCSITLDAHYITPQGQITDTLVRLLGLTGIRIEGDLVESDWPEPKLILSSRKLNEVVNAVQGKKDPKVNWLGNPIKERWEEDLEKSPLEVKQAKKIIELCDNDLRLSTEVRLKTTPKGILFLGAALNRVRTRLAFLNELYDKKLLSIFLPVYLLTGERTLDKDIGESQEDLMNQSNGIISFRNDWKPSAEHITDEGEMLKLVFAQSRHKDLAEKSIHLIYSPKGSGRRATTESTVVQWLNDRSPESGSYIAISNQPYVYYQELVIRRVLLETNHLDICVTVFGPGIPAQSLDDFQGVKKATDYLNSISRILYELEKIQRFQGNKLKTCSP